MLLEAYDVFCAHMPSLEHRSALLEHLGRQCDLPAESSKHVVERHKPEVALGTGSTTVGRVAFAPNDATAAAGALPAAFAPSRHALCMMERLAACVVMNEPGLLVGGESAWWTSTWEGSLPLLTHTPSQQRRAMARLQSSKPSLTQLAPALWCRT